MTDSAIAPPLRRFILLVALAQGLLVYLAHIGSAQDWWPFSTLGSHVVWYALVLSVPTMMLLSVRDPGQKEFWQHVALLAVVVGLLAAWIGWNVFGGGMVDGGSLLFAFTLMLMVGVFIALPYFQCRLQHRRWCAPYPELFEHAWQNGLSVILIAAFVGICWLVLMLWAALFALVKIEFFQDLFSANAFIHFITGLQVGLGVLIARTQQRALHIARQLLFAIFRGLLPLVALIVLLFVVSLPFTGLAPLWATRSATAILFWVLIVLVLFTNAVFQDGRGEPPYPRFLRMLVHGALVVSPIYAALALYALALRINQYGFTPDRVWALLIGVVLAVYACGYALAVLRRSAGWLGGVPRVNVITSLLILGLIVLVNSPVLDPYRISVASQLSALHNGRVPAQAVDVEQLRFDMGLRGYEAALALREDPAFIADAKAMAKLERVLARKSRYQSEAFDGQDKRPITDLALLRAHIIPAQGSAIPDDAWLQAVLDKKLPSATCLSSESDCIVIQRDLDDDGRAEQLLCDLRESWRVSCHLSTQDSAGHWKHVSILALKGASSCLRDELRAGKLHSEQPEWPVLSVAGVVAEATDAVSSPDVCAGQ